jgi:hypothetical protein
MKREFRVENKRLRFLVNLVQLDSFVVDYYLRKEVSK